MYVYWEFRHHWYQVLTFIDLYTLTCVLSYLSSYLIFIFIYLRLCLLTYFGRLSLISIMDPSTHNLNTILSVSFPETVLLYSFHSRLVSSTLTFGTRKKLLLTKSISFLLFLDLRLCVDCTNFLFLRSHHSRLTYFPSLHPIPNIKVPSV